MERQATIYITTEKTSMSEDDFRTVRDALDGAIIAEAEKMSEVSDQLEKLFLSIETDSDVLELITEGKVIEKPNGAVILQYDESELSGMAGCTTKIMFNKNKPSFVVMMRDGEVNTSLSFEPGKRHISTYNTPYMPFRLCVNTVRVENTFCENFEILIEYLIEIRGLSTDRNILRIKADIL